MEFKILLGAFFCFGMLSLLGGLIYSVVMMFAGGIAHGIGRIEKEVKKNYVL